MLSAKSARNVNRPLSGSQTLVQQIMHIMYKK